MARATPWRWRRPAKLRRVVPAPRWSTDPDTGRVLLFGGRDANGGLADLWALTGVPAGG